MSLHPPSHPFIPSLTVPKTKNNGDIVQLSGPVANLLASSSSSTSVVPSLPTRPPVPNPVILVRSVYIRINICIYVRACAAHQANTDRIDRPARAKPKRRKKRRRGKKTEAENEFVPPSFFAWASWEGFFMHAGHPSITWGENSPPATVPCVPCAPGSRESVSSHRYAHPHHQQHRHCVSVCLSACVCLARLSVVCCSSGPSIRQACPCSLPQQEGQDIFGDMARYLFCFAFGPLLSPSSPLGPSEEALVTRSSCTHRGGLTPHPQARVVVVRAPLDATVPFRADSCWVGGTP